MALTGNAQAQPAGLEAHLYTVEAVELYVRHLTPTGVLVLIHSDPGNAYRQLLTVIEALERIGVSRARALEGIAVLHDPQPGIAYRYMLVVRTSPRCRFEVADGLDISPAELLWGPGDPVERSVELLDPAKLGATADDDLTPVHDDRPYFFQNTKGLYATALAQPGRLWVLAGAILLVIVLGVERRGGALVHPPGRGRRAVSAPRFYASSSRSSSGSRSPPAARCTPSRSCCSTCSRPAPAAPDPERAVAAARARRLTWACLAAALAIASTALLVRDLAWLDSISSDAGRQLLIAALLAPTGLAIGGPFPVLLAHHGEPATRIASLWAINGAASVAGIVTDARAARRRREPCRSARRRLVPWRPRRSPRR